MNDMCIPGMRVVALAKDLEARALESNAQTKAPGNTQREGASHEGRATGTAETAGAGRWVSSESVPTENPRRFHYLEQSDLQEKLSRFDNMCITAILLYQHTSRRCRRPPWKKRKYVIVTTRPELNPQP